MVLRRRIQSRGRRRFKRGYRRRLPRRRTTRYATKRYVNRRVKRATRAEWKKIDDYVSATTTGSAFNDPNQVTFTSPRYFIPPVPYGITPGVGLNQRIGNSLSRLVFKCRWSFSLIGYDPVGGPDGPIATAQSNYNIFVRVIVFQYKRGNGVDAPDEDGDPPGNEQLYHPVNWPAYDATGNRSWLIWTNAYHSRIFGENVISANVVPPHLARLRVNIRDEIYVKHDKTYQLGTHSRSTISKRWSFRSSPYKWDENNIVGTDAVLYPQNAIRVLFIVSHPYQPLANDLTLLDGLNYRLDWTSSIRYQDK